MHMVDFAHVRSEAEYREQLEHARAEARRRYRDHLAAAFELHRCPQPETLADLALKALTDWRYIDSGERCRCGCHPRLPESDFHDYGFDCVCTRTPEDRRRSWQKWRQGLAAIWESPEGQQIKADAQTAEADLQAWLAGQSDVIVRSHGGWFPEEWTGEVDGHSFYFCERRGEWRIELDLRPSGRFVRTLTEDDSDGAGQCYERELDEGDVIASGTIDVEGYGSTPAQRADFIIDTIRVHLARQACTLHRDNLPSIQASLGGVLSWCPACGTRLSTS
ncbi:hypothetical protein MINTM008_15880 [Mycobacterium intracellulare]|jgi:hypothetical protein|uniref:Uncharacterized protein n=4 Tax=Mycobacterium TaxID=1763 RepID=A0A7R7MTZ7_MYCIT|nr:hypothetical protein [Mycobacterium nebraskense]BCO45668.1 hypothetical protein MINTM002_13420 [Mycobacterium intracellulare]BCO56176.1 hypothetical protein MINTM005_14200 [Mycobacterium intracellulare]BCO61498.1 hypothetical protein MINTM006_14480 [Mycobacterium intracellulare]BCO66702.1 hypothetical protein MINTM007_13130 [Mycobacterium intracellulare]BCO72253.1 hypothetical protein MINTM008_15880 [Mycobacterium intracellulare]